LVRFWKKDFSLRYAKNAVCTGLTFPYKLGRIFTLCGQIPVSDQRYSVGDAINARKQAIILFNEKDTMKTHFVLTAMVLAITVGLSACTVTPAHYSARGPNVVVLAPVAPPPPRYEPVPPPRPDYVWAPGYWHWENDRHHWVDGHWEQHRPNERWVAHRWDQDDRGHWRLNGGWHRD
jgi:hypothetical protein